jgi:hypothetical protein
MLTGMYYFGRRYTLTKYISVLMVTIGIIICTIESGKEVKCCGESTKKVRAQGLDGKNLFCRYFRKFVSDSEAITLCTVPKVRGK